MTALLNRLVFGNRHGIFIPHRLKNARLCMIPKNDSTAEERPLLLNSRLLALLDRLVNRILMKLMDNDETLDNRHAFRDGRGVEDAIAEIVNFVETGKNQKKKVAICQTDMSNAFNGTNHKLIILRTYELLQKNKQQLDNECSWVILYLKDWLHRYVYFESTSFPLLNGVPQGSPLRPSIFSLVFAWNYSADGLVVVYYADDVSILIMAEDWKEVAAILNAALRDCNSWCEVNDFQINIGKSKYLLFSATNVNDFEIDDEYKEIEQVPVPCILGVRFDTKFNFNWHLQSVEQYMRRRVAALRKLRQLGLAEKCLKAICLCLRSKITFGLWHLMTISKTNWDRLERI